MESDKALTGINRRLLKGDALVEGTKMPFSKLTDEQILQLVAEQPKMESVPGVALVWVEFIDPTRTQVAVVVSVYTGGRHEISQLPVTVAGLPVIVRVEDPDTMRVVETIDPRKNGGVWPRTNHHDSSGI